MNQDVLKWVLSENMRRKKNYLEIFFCFQKDLKTENSKTLTRLAEQSNRCQEMKFKNDELNKAIETKVTKEGIIEIN
jgi:hypothetical protein